MDKHLKKRIREGAVRKRDVARRLGELAFGRANDCVRLVLEEDPDLGKLDLSLLSEVRRNDKGTVEVRLMDRLQALEQLAALTGEEEGELDEFLQALRGGEQGVSYQAFSPKQRRVLTWWVPGNPDEGYDAIVCDGAVRSGKTLAMGLGFFLWAETCFDGQKFGVCGKTISSLRRNVLSEILPRLTALGAAFEERRSENYVTVRFRGRENRFYIFGGRDESSAALIQGVTFAGVLLDEAALMPRSFVEQACARCSVAGSRLWFNCNPAGPNHWFYKTWILEAEQRNCLRLHFTMEDNPSLTAAIRQRYERLYTGVFYQRFVQGLWVQAEGRVYDFFEADMAGEAPADCESWYISCDYGTVNPTSMGLWGKCGEIWYRVKEFYFDSRAQKRQMTDEEYGDALEKLAGGREIQGVIVDPSAASFMEVLRRRGWRVQKASNDVLSGIRLTSDLLKSGKIVICRDCHSCLREMEEYVWDLAAGGDRVKKEHDHAMDDMRYFVSTVLGKKQNGGFGVWSVERRTT